MNSFSEVLDVNVLRGELMPRTIGLPQVKVAHVLETRGFIREASLFRPPPQINVISSTQIGSSPGAVRWEAPSASSSTAPLHLLVVDEDLEIRSACGEIARRMGFAVVQAAELLGARAILRHQKVDLILMDLRSSGVNGGMTGGGMALLQEVKSSYPDTNVIVMTASGTVTNAVEAMRLGAEDYLTKPFALEDLRVILERTSKRTHLNQETRHLRERLRNQKGSGPLVGHSPEMEKLYRILSKVSHSSHPVLILGESGTGKELVARSIHFNGSNPARTFSPVDCGSFAPEQIEGQLFGYVQESRNGERPVVKDGLLVSAQGGTVFLDEISELNLDLQSKLLLALQEKAVRPVGGSHTVPMSARILAGTNADLVALVEQGKFRRDLYFRLNVVSLRIPPLRQRKDDIPELALYFMARLKSETSKSVDISDDVLRTLLAYEWPGNVRELEDSIERALEMSSGPVLHIGDLSPALQAVHARINAQPVAIASEGMTSRSSTPTKILSIAELERHAILGTVRQLKGDKLLAAKLLGIGKTTLYRKLKEYGPIMELAGFD